MAKPPGTPEKPAFSLVSPATTGPEPPRPLGAAGRALWDRIQREFQIRDAGGVELLAQACGALDRLHDLAAAIARDGSVIYGARGGAPRTHPAVKEELACRAFVVKTLERLGVTLEPVKPMGRPGGGVGWIPDSR